MKKPLVIVFILLALAAVVAVVTVFFATRLEEPPVAPAAPAEQSAVTGGASAAKPQPLSRYDIPPPPPVREPGTSPDSRALDPIPVKVNLSGPPFERRKDGKILKRDVADSAEDLNDASHDPVEDVQILGSIVNAYRTIFKQNPIAGENREVVEALTGKNEYNLAFIDPAHPAISAEGELIDRWGVPYRFHPISGEHMEILSAGEDGQFGTGDDVMVDEPVVIGDFGPES